MENHPPSPIEKNRMVRLKVYRLRKVDAERIPTKTEYSFKGL